MVALNDNFVATFVTIMNLLFSALFLLVAQMMEYQNSELDYHICTGNHPQVNILRSPFIVAWIRKNNSPGLSLEDLSKNDPLWYLSRIIFFLLLIVTLNIWVYSRKEFFKRIWKKKFIRNSIILFTITDLPVKVERGSSFKFEQFNKTKNAIIGASGTFVAIALLILLLFPSIISKSYAQNNAEEINYGSGRFWTCFSRINLPIVSYCVIPLVVITSNAKMREVLIRHLKAFATN